MEMVPLRKPPPQRLGCPRALRFPPTDPCSPAPHGAGPHGGLMSPQQSGPAPAPPHAAGNAVLNEFGSLWHCCEATWSTTAWGACGEPGSAL